MSNQISYKLGDTVKSINENREFLISRICKDTIHLKMKPEGVRRIVEKFDFLTFYSPMLGVGIKKSCDGCDCGSSQDNNSPFSTMIKSEVLDLNSDMLIGKDSALYTLFGAKTVRGIYEHLEFFEQSVQTLISKDYKLPPAYFIIDQRILLLPEDLYNVDILSRLASDPGFKPKKTPAVKIAMLINKRNLKNFKRGKESFDIAISDEIAFSLTKSDTRKAQKIANKIANESSSSMVREIFLITTDQSRIATDDSVIEESNGCCASK